MLQPEHVAGAWRQARAGFVLETQGGMSLLEDVVDSFVREVGNLLNGAAGSPWSRTQGVLRLSPMRGVRGLREEFLQLRQCFSDALTRLRADDVDRMRTLEAVDSAEAAAEAMLVALDDAHALAPAVPFGGLVVELVEHAPHALDVEVRDTQATMR